MNQHGPSFEWQPPPQPGPGPGQGQGQGPPTGGQPPPPGGHGHSADGPPPGYGGPPPGPVIPGMTIIEGQPALPVEPTLFQRATFVFYWIGVIAVPVGWITIRAALNLFGWLTIIAIIFGTLVVMGIQIVFGAVAAANSHGFSRKAVGTNAGIATLVYYGLLAFSAICFDDIYEAGNDVTGTFPGLGESPVSFLVGTEAAFFIGIAAFIAAAVAAVATLAFISVDASKARQQALQNYRMAAAGSFNARPPGRSRSPHQGGSAMGGP